MSDDDHERSPHAWDLPLNPHAPQTPWGAEAQIRGKALALDVIEIKNDLKALNKLLDAAREQQTKAGWELQQLQDHIAGRDGLRDQLKEIRAVMPDMRMIKSVLYGAGALLLSAVGYAVLRAIGLGK